MLNVEETLLTLPELSDDDLNALEDTVGSDESLGDDERQELLEAIDEEWDERDLESDEEDDVFADDLDEVDEDEEDTEGIGIE